MRGTLESLVSFLLDKRPEDPVPYIIQYLQDMKGVGAPSLSMEEKLELESLRTQATELKLKIQRKE